MQSLEEVAICDVYPYERADGEPMNPRDFTTRESAEHIAGLAAQFKANRLNPGQPVMKPILYKEGGIYWIIDGECRVRAMRAIGTEHFLAEVYDDLDDAELARVEAAKAMVETDAKLGLTAEEKSRGLAGSAMGIVGLETAFPLLYKYLVLPGTISLERLFDLMSKNPRRIFGLEGGVEAGDPADFTVLDLGAQYRVDPETFLSKGRATPFAGWEVQGRAVLTVVGGKEVYDEMKVED